MYFTGEAKGRLNHANIEKVITHSEHLIHWTAFD